MAAPESLNVSGDAGLQLHSALRLVPMHPGEPCGDTARHFKPAGNSTAAGEMLAIVDGLGHGPEAAKAADASLRVMGSHPELALPALLGALDAGLADTRGAAIGLVRVQGLRAWYAGVGNTRALRWRGERMLRLPSQPGIVGGGLPERVMVTEIDLQTGDWLLLFTDGLDEMLSLPAHLPEWEREPAMLCDHLLDNWRVGRDDAGVLVCRVGCP